MDPRKTLKLTYKETPRPMGICQVKHLPTGKVYLERSVNTDGLLNRFRFTLRLGKHPVAGLQADWNRDGESAFSFEVLELLDREKLGMKDPLKALCELESRWIAQLQPYGERGYHGEAPLPGGR